MKINKKKLLREGLIIFILSIIPFYQYLQGLNPIGYLSNIFYNLKNKNSIVTNIYNIDLPFFSWRIESEDNEHIFLLGHLTEKGFLQISLSKKKSSLHNIKIEEMCNGKQSTSEIYLDGNKATNIYCDNSDTNELEPFRLIVLKDKLSIFMYKYQKKFQYQYQKFISSVVIID